MHPELLSTMNPQLLRKLIKPSKVASILDWKKTFDNTVLALNIHKNRVGIAVASHPSLDKPCIELEPLRFEDNNGNRKNIAKSIDRHCLERFSDIIEKHKVCGIVVNWPMRRDTGKMGAACGRVMFTLEQLVERSNEIMVDDPYANGNSIKNQDRGGFLSRPFCLWDAGHSNLMQQADPSKRVDAFGRCASYGKETHSFSSIRDQHQCNKVNQYFAAKEQYHEDELTVVLGVWDDFCREHWPDLYENNKNSSILEIEEEIENTPPTRCNEYSDSGSTPDQIPMQMPSPRLQSMAKMKQKKSLIIMR